MNLLAIFRKLSKNHHQMIARSKEVPSIKAKSNQRVNKSYFNKKKSAVRPQLSSYDIQLRQAIKKKYQKSEIKTYRFDRMQQKDFSEYSSSPPSSDCLEYSFLKKKFIKLKYYHQINQAQNCLNQNSGEIKKKRRTFSENSEADAQSFQHKNLYQIRTIKKPFNELISLPLQKKKLKRNLFKVENSFSLSMKKVKSQKQKSSSPRKGRYEIRKQKCQR